MRRSGRHHGAAASSTTSSTPIRRPGRAEDRHPRDRRRPTPGGPRTFLILGSDKRTGAERTGSSRARTRSCSSAPTPTRRRSRSCRSRATSRSTIPGHGTDKINAAFEHGGPGRLTVADDQEAVQGRDRPGPSRSTTSIGVDFGSFRRAVNYIDGVYVDVDRHYFNDNSSGEHYATIDIKARLPEADGQGRARLRALPPHRQRLHPRRAPAGLPAPGAQTRPACRRLLPAVWRSAHCARVFGRYFRVDKSFRSTKQIFSMLGSRSSWRRSPSVNEVRFPADDAPNPAVDTRLYRGQRARRRLREFMNAKASVKPPPASKPTADQAGVAQRKKATATRPPTCRGSRRRARRARIRP